MTDPTSKEHSCTGGLGCCAPHGDCPHCGCEGKIAAARRTAEHWKREHLAGNAEIERLRAAHDKIRDLLQLWHDESGHHANCDCATAAALSSAFETSGES